MEEEKTFIKIPIYDKYNFGTSWIVCSINNLKVKYTCEMLFFPAMTWSSWCTTAPRIQRSPQILGTGQVTSSKFHTEDPQILGTTMKKGVTLTTWQPRSVHPCSSLRWDFVIEICYTFSAPIFFFFNLGKRNMS
jgi:hypothetical protein